MKPIKAAIISIKGTSLSDDDKYLLEQENPLGVSLFSRNIQNKEQLKALTSEIKNSIQRNNFLIATDQEGGRVCRLKAPEFREYMAQSAIATLEPENAELASLLHAELITDDFQQTGINCNFAPTLDVSTPDITVALKSRCFSDNQFNTEKLARIMIQSYHKNGIVACIKHFPGHSGATVDPHLQLPIVEHIDNRVFYPFQKISPFALMGMTAHICLPEIDNLPVTFSARAIQSIIRNDFGFRGILISDALEMHALKGSLTEKTSMAIKAGCEAVLYCKGDIMGCTEVLSNCGYLSDTAMEKLANIENIITKKYSPDNIQNKAAIYKNLYNKAVHFHDDYDAIEILNKL